MRRSLFDVLPVVAATMLLFAGGAEAHTLAANKRAARRNARVLLGRLHLPAGAIELASGRSTPAGPAVSPNDVDFYTRWRVQQSTAKVAGFVKLHPPRGGGDQLTSWGSNGQMVIAYFWPAIPGVLYVRQLTVELHPLPGGFTAVRADAAVQPTVPRPAGDSVPRAARVLTVTRGAFPGWPPPLSATFTGHTRVRSVARVLDRLQIVQPGGVIACPAILAAPTITFTFRARLGGPPLARASVLASGPAGPCSPISFAVHGRHEPPLLAQPSFLRRVARILGTALR